MNTLDAIFSRKSIRSYTGEMISEEELKTILKAAYAAPCGMGKYDSLRINVITDKELLAEIDEAAAKLFGKPGIHPLYGAPCLILVSTAVDTEAFMPVNISASNAACVVESMAFAATELNLGNVLIWGAVHAIDESPEIQAKLSIPEGFRPSCGLAIGKMEGSFELREIPENRIETIYN